MKRARTPFLLAVGLLALLWTAGCQNYEVTVTIDSSGGGTRSIELQSDVDWLRDGIASLAQFRELYGVTAAQGWSATEEQDPQSDQLRSVALQRTTTIANLSDWAAQSGDLRILGSRDPAIAAQVRFDNTVTVEIAPDDSSRILTYRERFAWQGLREKIAAFMARRAAEEVRAAEPGFSAGALAELRGAVRALTLMTIDMQARDVEPEENEDLLQAVLRTELAELARRHDPQARQSDFAALAERIVTKTFEEFDEYAERELTGVHLAWATHIALRVDLPGEILETNATTTENRSAIWEFDLGDLTDQPLEILARVRLAP